MDDTTTTEAPAEEAVVAETTTDAVGAIEVDEELLIEEVSIDGMCGVY
jgi:mycofactocin precursor